jgi:hypothetical protein
MDELFRHCTVAATQLQRIYEDSDVAFDGSGGQTITNPADTPSVPY